MLDLSPLLDRDREEALRISSRSLVFSDGREHKIKAYRLTWRWYDALIAYEYGPDEREILSDLAKTLEALPRDPGEALAEVVQYQVHAIETQGGDVTDDNPILELAQGRMAAWRRRQDPDHSG